MDMGEVREGSAYLRKVSNKNVIDSNVSQKRRQDFHNLRYFPETLKDPWTSKMDSAATIVTGKKPFTIVAKSPS